MEHEYIYMLKKNGEVVSSSFLLSEVKMKQAMVGGEIIKMKVRKK